MADERAIERLRKALGDTGTPPAFSDAELALLLDDRAGDELAARVDGLWQLLMQAAKLHDYTVGLSQERKSQVAEGLRKDHATASAELASQRAATAAALREATAGTTGVGVPVQFTW